MERIPLKALARREGGKNFCRRLRASGQIPAILYGTGGDPVNLTLITHDFQKSTAKLSGEMVLFSVSAQELGIEDQLAVIRELQRDPVTERIVHIDLMRVDLTKPIDVVISIHSTGSPAGVRDGGVLEQITRNVHLRCLPNLVPPHIAIDVSGLELNQAFHVRDLALDEQIEVLTPASDVIFHVIVPKRVEEAETTVAAEGTAVEGETPAEGAEEKKSE